MPVCIHLDKIQWPKFFGQIFKKNVCTIMSKIEGHTRLLILRKFSMTAAYYYFFLSMYLFISVCLYHNCDSPSIRDLRVVQV